MNNIIMMATKKRCFSPTGDLRDSEPPMKPCGFEAGAGAQSEDGIFLT